MLSIGFSLREVILAEDGVSKRKRRRRIQTMAMSVAWYGSEFAAANAIIDALCAHLAQVSDRGISDCEAVFGAIHRRRMNWIPVLQMQTYHSIDEVVVELQNLADKKIGNKAEEESFDEKESVGDNGRQISEDDLAGKETALENDDPANSDSIDSGNRLCTNHKHCKARPAQIKLTQGFSAKEFVKGNRVNAVNGLRLYENVFTDSELSKLNDLVNALRVAGQTGQLLGETFVLFNQQEKDCRRELVQLGVPIFRHINEDEAVNTEPIPVLLLAVIDHLVQWGLISKYKKPNGCIINFFDEEEQSQPFQKPPHLDEPLVALFLSETTMVFGRRLKGRRNGKYKGPLMLCLKKGSLLVMRGNSANMAMQCVCPSPDKRVSIIFFRVRHDANNRRQSSASLPIASAMPLWQPDVSSSYGLPNASLFGYGAMDAMPDQGFLYQSVFHSDPMLFGPRILLPGGSREDTMYLPPSARARRGRLLALASTAESNAPEPQPEPEPEP